MNRWPANRWQHPARKPAWATSPWSTWGLGVLIALALLPACTPVPALRVAPLPQAVRAPSPGFVRQPIIVVPGFQGSTLLDTETERRVWGAFAGDYARPDQPEGMRLIALPMQPGVPFDRLRDSVVADGLLTGFRFKLLRLLPVHADGYNHLIDALEADGYRFEPPGATSGTGPASSRCYDAFVFTYDWRRDNAENARRLFAFVSTKRAQLQRLGCYAGEDERFDLVAHSMGGLVARYFLRYGAAPLSEEGPLPAVTWAGAAYVRNAVLIAPPNAGSLRIFKALTEGRAYLPGVGRFEPAMLGTLPALYQLLPRAGGGRVVLSTDTSATAGDLLEPATWERWGWSLADPSQAAVLRALLPGAISDAARRRIALDHLTKCLRRARRFAEALDVPAEPPGSLSVHLVVGDTRATDAVAAWDVRAHRLRVIERRQGDSCVLSASALTRPAPSTSSPPPSVALVTGKHMSMTRQPDFAGLLARSLGGPPLGERPLRKPSRPATFAPRLILRTGVSLARPYAAEGFALGPAPSAAIALEGALEYPLTPRWSAGLAATYARLPELRPGALGDQAADQAATQLDGGAVHYARLGMSLTARLPLRPGLDLLLQGTPGWTLGRQGGVEATSASDEAVGLLRRPAWETTFSLPVGIGAEFWLTQRFGLTVQMQKEVLSLVQEQDERLLGTPFRVGFSYRLWR